MIKKIISSILIQSLGTVASFATVWFVTYKYGVSAQGDFALIKSWVDLLVVIGCFGFPQSFAYSINKSSVNIDVLKGFSVVYSSVNLLLFLGLTIIWCRINAIQNTAVFYISITAAILVLHGLFRGIYLTINDSNKFAILSIIPSLSLFIGFQFNFSDQLNLSNVYLISTVFVLISSILYLSKIKTSYKVKSVKWRGMVLDGFNVFMQSIAIALVPMISFSYLNKSGLSGTEIGSLSIANYFYLAFSMPLNMISPILFNTWMKSNRAIKKTDLLLLFMSGVGVFVFSCLSIYLLPNLLTVMVLHDDVRLIYKAASILMLSASPLFLAKIIGAYLQARGMFFYVTVSYTIKMVVCLLLLFFARKLSVMSVSYAWLFGDIVLFVVLLIGIFMVGKRDAYA